MRQPIDATEAADMKATLARLMRDWMDEMNRIATEADARVEAYTGKPDL
jgi:hypothetical protein